MWIKSTKPKLLDYLLAQQVANNYFINSTNKVEPISNFSFGTSFSKNIFIDAKKKALKEAKKYHTGNVFWVNRLKLSQKNARTVICWKTKEYNN